MTIGFIFWLIMLLSFVFNAYWNWPKEPNGYGVFGGSFLLFILLFLLGWKVFGFPIQG